MKVEVDLTEYGVKAPKLYDPINPRVINAAPKNQMVNYSTVEARIGTWIDGKPLYQKTVDCGALPNETTKSVPHGISNINADTIVDIKGIARYSGHYAIALPKVHDRTIGSQVMIEVDSTNIILYSRDSNQSAYNAYVTIQYTKTTD